jgi:hypothetical protein
LDCGTNRATVLLPSTVLFPFMEGLEDSDPELLLLSPLSLEFALPGARFNVRFDFSLSNIHPVLEINRTTAPMPDLLRFAFFIPTPKLEITV